MLYVDIFPDVLDHKIFLHTLSLDPNSHAQWLPMWSQGIHQCDGTFFRIIDKFFIVVSFVNTQRTSEVK